MPYREVECPQTCPPLGLTTKGTIERVIDGDTPVVLVRDFLRLRIRLLRCWAPESRTRDLHEKRMGLAAKAELQKCEGQGVVVFIPTEDVADLMQIATMGRILAYVWLEGEDESLNDRQCRLGLAWPTKEEAQAAVEESRQ